MRNVFVLGLNDFNLAKLRSLRGAEDCAFHGLLDAEEILEADEYPVRALLRRAGEQLRAFEGSIDAIVGYMDFPVSTMLPILAAELDLPSVSMESLLKCEHKYWSRLEQRRVVPEHVPRFVAFDPFHPDPHSQIDLDYPYWVKPIKSAGSWLGFHVGDRDDLDRAVSVIRAHIGRFGDPFNDLLEYVDLPPEVAEVGGNHCLAEALIGGHQCTVEGSVFEGRVDVHGVVDSVREPGGTSFSRYQYPTRLGPEAIERMSRITRTVLGHIGFDTAAFNVEYFLDESTDHIWLLEINTRVAQHHSELFEKVDGVSNHQIMLDVHLGRRPQLPSGQGPFDCAAAFFLRHHEDAVVTRVPSAEEIAALESRFPGCVVELHVRAGTRLSELVDQDSYSYELALFYLGARDEAQLLERHAACRDALLAGFELTDADAPRGEASSAGNGS